jgi:enolase
MTGGHAITSAKARIVFDSRGSETIEVELGSDGLMARVSAPAGKSRGGREVQAYPPDGPGEAVQIFNKLVKPKIIGVDPADQKGVDGLLKEIDGTSNLSTIGGNTAYSVSICTATLASKLAGVELWQHIARLSGLKPSMPYPLGNVLGGGSHAGAGAPDIQEILTFPTEAENPYQAIRYNISVHKRLGERLASLLPDYGGGRGDEGAYAPPLENEAAIKAVREASAGLPVHLGLDVAASTFYDRGRVGYVYRRAGFRDRMAHMEFLEMLALIFAVKYMEDPVEEGDWDGFREMRKRLPNILICGDDLVVTRAELIREAARTNAINAVILKPNQVGTLTETLEAVREADRAGLVKVFSHRSGETCDSSLAHIAVGTGANLIKMGVLGGERVAKANELLRIWEKADGKLEMSRVGVS